MALDFFAGCLGGAAGVIVGHPLDTVKVRLQTQSPDNIKYRGTFHCLSTIARQESIAGLYKGISSPLLGVAGVNAIIFGVYGLLRPLVADAPGNNALWAHFAAGSASGAIQSVIASPMELVKTRMQLDESNAARKPSSLDVLKGIYRTEGGLARGVMKGWSVTVAREIPGFGAYFATYEALTRNGQVGTFGMMMAGGMAGVASWVLCFPADVIKTRLQSDTVGKYSGAIDCFRKTYNKEGYKAFTRGLASTVIRAFPTNAATFTVVTWIMRLAEEKQDDLQNSHQQLEHLLQEWDAARLQQKLFNYDMMQMNVTKQRHYEYMSLASQCVLPQQSFSGYLNASAFSAQGNTKISKDSSMTMETLKSMNADSQSKTQIARSEIESRSSDCGIDCRLREPSPQPPNMNSHSQQFQNAGEREKTPEKIRRSYILTTTESSREANCTNKDNSHEENSHGTSTFPADSKAVAQGGKDRDTSSRDSEEDESISNLVKAWIKDNWASFSVCKCYGDHCICYI